MSITDALLEALPAGAPVREVLIGAFWTAVVLDTDPPRCGLASTLRGGTHDHADGPAVREAGRLSGRSGRELAELLRSKSILEASVGLAAYNALLEVDTSACVEVNAEDVILANGAGRRVAVVGHFPFVDRVREAASACWVIDLNPRPGDLPGDQAAALLPQADVVALTGTSLLNHTFDGLLALCRPDALVLVLGPSAPLTPLFFERGVGAVSGTLVTDPGRVLRAVGQGANFRQIKRAGGLRLLTLARDNR